MYCKSNMYVVNTTPTLVQPNSVVPVTTIIRRKNACAIDNNAGVTQLKQEGYYLAIVSATFTAPEAGNVTLTLQTLVNGQTTSIPGATATETITTANTETRSICFATNIHVGCNINQVTLLLTGTATLFANVSIVFVQIA